MRHYPVYLASRYSRREELQGYAQQLAAMDGFSCTSRWLTGEHDWAETQINQHGERDPAAISPLAQQYAIDDLADIDIAQGFVVFTDPPGQNGPRARGGLHVEFGWALSRNKDLLVVGPRTNVFYHLPQVRHAPDWDQALLVLQEMRSRPAWPWRAVQ